MNDQPKPTGEWTPTHVHKLALPYDEILIDACVNIADAHNAALDAEREKYLNEARAWFDRDKQLREQLAAEREKRDYWEQAYNQLFDAATTGIL